MSERIKRGIPSDQVVAVAASPQELPAAHVETPFDHYYRNLWDELLNFYSEASGIPLEDLIRIYEQEQNSRQQNLNETTAPIINAPVEFDKTKVLWKKANNQGYYTFADVLEATGTLYPHILSPGLYKSLKDDPFLPADVAILDRLQKKGAVLKLCWENIWLA